MVDKTHAHARSGADKFPTPLDAFLKANKLRAVRVARGADCSRQHLYRLRKGVAEPTRPLMVAITRACSKLAKRRVRMADLFVLEEKRR
jgi:hypothetical protein